MRKIFRLVLSERGSAESAMVLIPLLILFLVGMQLSLASHTRNSMKMTAQDSASTRGISGDFLPGDEFIHIDSSGDGQNLDLLVTHQESGMLDLIPGFLASATAGRSIEVRGLAIVENQR